jgi:small subunit ribosomal protein S1
MSIFFMKLNDIQVLHLNDLVEGPVIHIEQSSVFIDLKPYGTGIIYGREFIGARDLLRKVAIGDIIKAKVVDIQNEDGYVELSLKEARQALMWSDAEKAIRARTIFTLPIKEANKGGLLIEWNGLLGFLPASQLKSENYPKVEDGDKDAIVKELQKLVGKSLDVTIIGAQPKEGKLIFSEKDGGVAMERSDMVSKYHVGQDVDATVSGMVDFGVFLKVEEGLEGLAHISEIDWALVEDPRKLYKVGDKVRAKIIEIKESKISFSIKALKDNPWKEFEGKLKKGDTIRGAVIKYNKHGALVAIKEGVAGLVHHSGLGGEEKMKEKLELGKSYDFDVTLFDPKEQRMTLSLKA